MWEHNEKATICKLSPETESAGTLNLPISRSVGNKFLLFKSPRLWCVIMAVPAN